MKCEVMNDGRGPNFSLHPCLSNLDEIDEIEMNATPKWAGTPAIEIDMWRGLPQEKEKEMYMAGTPAKEKEMYMAGTPVREKEREMYMAGTPANG